MLPLPLTLRDDSDDADSRLIVGALIVFTVGSLYVLIDLYRSQGDN